MILDSNVIIIASKLTHPALLTYLKEAEAELRVSAVTKIEVLGYHQLQKMEKLFLENFFNAIPNLPIDRAVVEKSIELRQKRPLSIGDAIIAATGLLYDLPILTENKKDYTGIQGIKLFSIKEVLLK